MRGIVPRGWYARAAPNARSLWVMCAILLLASVASAVPIINWDILGSDEQTLFSEADISAVGTQPDTVTFRLYGYDYTAPTDYSGLGNHPGPTPLSGTGTNLTVGGQLVPEPVTLAQLGLGLAMLVFAGRRRCAR